METKYYTPKLDEFFQGFEYEVLIKEHWEKQDLLYSNKYIKVHGFSYLDSLIQGARVRVKYLDKEDIESLGWKIEKVDKLRYKLDFTKVFSKNNWILVYYTFESVLPNKLIIYNNTYTDCIFKGTIKNKSELIKLLKQLEINED
jgi:hypothetical protein